MVFAYNNDLNLIVVTFITLKPLAREVDVGSHCNISENLAQQSVNGDKPADLQEVTSAVFKFIPSLLFEYKAAEE